MILLIFEEGDGIPIFVLSMDIIIAPIVFFQIQKYRGKIRQKVVIGADEVTFDEKFPALPGHEDKPKAPVIEKNQGLLCAILTAVTAISIAVSFFAINLNPSEVEEGFTIFTDPAMKIVWILMLVLLVTYVVVFAGVVQLNKFKKPDSPAAEPVKAEGDKESETTLS